jgi:glycosyltransferase involved in cell wall biosynthesis
VLEQILALFPAATLYTLMDFMAPEHKSRLGQRCIKTSFLQRMPGARSSFTRYLPLMPLAIQQFDLSGHDLIISSSHCVAKGVITPPDALHLCYCHSPMRYAWDMQGEYLRTEGLDRGVKTVLARWMFHRLRQWDVGSSNGADHFAANSRFVQQRIQKTWRRDAVVIHPPVELAAPNRSDAQETTSGADAPRRRAQHYVTVGRLMGYKNTALMVEAFRRMSTRQLTVVGQGPQFDALKRSAPGNVHMAGHLDEAALREQVQTATAFVFAAIEDFGIAPVEALALGTPVVAYARGGALDYLKHGENAWLFDALTPQSLAAAIEASEPAWPADVDKRCRASAARFGGDRFGIEFMAWVQTHWSQWRLSTAATSTTVAG